MWSKWGMFTTMGTTSKGTIGSLKVIGLLLLVSYVTNGLMCDRTTGMTVARTPGNGKFEVIIQGSEGKYVPGGIYAVRIQGQGDPYGTEKFSRFLLVAEPDRGNAGQVSAGTFRLKDDSLARFSEFCPNAVKHASEVPKSEVQVLWNAPPVAAGCVIFKATVVKNNQQWYMDDDDLTEKLCPQDEAQQEDNPEPCRACDEAKYELTFEGIWSSLTHPRHFPLNLWTANFSDIIGASHGPHFRLWDNGKLASEGLRQVAELGDSRLLEGELKEQSENIRTIIKARGLRHTNFNGLKTFAVFRADKNHNFISLVSKIDPSPDWFVGVSAFNLCGNGTWLLDKELDLFPFDAGTDSGQSYLSDNSPTQPPADIQRLLWSSNPESPFYDSDGKTLKPFAKLRIQQQRTYKRGSCEETSQPIGSTNDYGDDEFFDESPDKHKPECQMTPWSQWSPCTPTCGKGIRKKTRRFINEASASGCNRREVMEKVCHNPQSCKGTFASKIPSSFDESSTRHPTYDQLNVYNDNRNVYNRGPPGTTESGLRKFGTREEGPRIFDPMDDVCGTTEWRPWSHCPDPCGTGVRFQTRSFLRPAQAKRNKCEIHVKLRNPDRCPRTPQCSESQPSPKEEEGCEVSDWGPFGPCSVTCGTGVKIRYRMHKFPAYDHRNCSTQMQDTQLCEGIQRHCPPERTTEDCLEPFSAGECRQKLTRWYFDRVKLRCHTFVYSGCKATRNNFKTLQECDLTCLSLQVALAEERSEIQSKYGVVISSAFTYIVPAQPPHCDNLTNVPMRGRHSRLGEDTSTPYNPYAGTVGDGYSRQSGATRMDTQAHAHSQRYQSQPTIPPATNIHQVGGAYHAGAHQPRPFSPSYSDDGPSIDCKLSAWSPWSGCSVSCGRGWKYQSRYVEVFNENGGRPCSPLLERSRRCRGTNCRSGHAQVNSGFHHIDDYNYQD